MPGTSTKSVSLGDLFFDLFAVLLRQRSRQISLTAGSVLRTLERGGPMRVGDLAISEGVAQPSMTTLVDQLCKLDLAERRPDPTDGRVVMVSISKGGLDYLAQRRRQISDRVDEAIKALPADERVALRGAGPALHHVLDAIEELPVP